MPHLHDRNRTRAFGQRLTTGNVESRWGIPEVESTPTGKYTVGKGHRATWAAAYGPIPAGMVIHHINGDTSDDRLENLACMTRQEHNRLPKSDEARWRALERDIARLSK